MTSCFDLNSSDGKLSNLSHAGLGIGGEAGEVVDIIKKAELAGKEPDVEDLKLEIGDLLWYLSILCRELNFSLEECMWRNIEKLNGRHPGRLK